MDLIQQNQVDKVGKLLERGLDPNYHDGDTGGKAAGWTQTQQRFTEQQKERLLEK